MKIEFLLAREDHTWDTIIEEIPDAVEDCGYDVVKWFLSGIENKPGYEDVVCAAIYLILSEE
jgi:hypothetical protein